jgi:hypothetical protein
VITVEGVPVSEYAVEYSVDGLEATCWIASQNDEVFDFFLLAELPTLNLQLTISPFFHAEFLYQHEEYGCIAESSAFRTYQGGRH